MAQIVLERNDPPIDLMDIITELADLRRALNTGLAQYVQDARANEFSWERIALALGTTPQAAQQRYGKAKLRSGKGKEVLG